MFEGLCEKQTVHMNASDVKRVENVEATSQLAALCVYLPAVFPFFFFFLIMNCVKSDSGDVFDSYRKRL